MNRIVSGRINIENVTVKLKELLKNIQSFSDSIHELSMEDIKKLACQDSLSNISHYNDCLSMLEPYFCHENHFTELSSYVACVNKQLENWLLLDQGETDLTKGIKTSLDELSTKLQNNSIALRVVCLLWCCREWKSNIIDIKGQLYMFTQSELTEPVTSEQRSTYKYMYERIVTLFEFYSKSICEMNNRVNSVMSLFTKRLSITNECVSEIYSLMNDIRKNTRFLTIVRDRISELATILSIQPNTHDITEFYNPSVFIKSFSDDSLKEYFSTNGVSYTIQSGINILYFF